MGELRKSSASVFFAEDLLVVATLKSWGGFGGLKSLEIVDGRSSDSALGSAVRRAWEGRERVDVYDEQAIDRSWDALTSAFGVDRYSMVRNVSLNRLDHIRAVPTEWKGDNRFNKANDVVILPLDVLDEELGAAVRRAMELTVS